MQNYCHGDPDNPRISLRILKNLDEASSIINARPWFLCIYHIIFKRQPISSMSVRRRSSDPSDHPRPARCPRNPPATVSLNPPTPSPRKKKWILLVTYGGRPSSPPPPPPPSRHHLQKSSVMKPTASRKITMEFRFITPSLPPFFALLPILHHGLTPPEIEQRSALPHAGRISEESSINGTVKGVRFQPMGRARDTYVNINQFPHISDRFLQTFWGKLSFPSPPPPPSAPDETLNLIPSE